MSLKMSSMSSLVGASSLLSMYSGAGLQHHDHAVHWSKVHFSCDIMLFHTCPVGTSLVAVHA